MNSVKWQWIERPLCVREVTGPIAVGDSDISLSHARAMLINSSFTRNKHVHHYWTLQENWMTEKQVKDNQPKHSEVKTPDIN